VPAPSFGNAHFPSEPLAQQHQRLGGTGACQRSRAKLRFAGSAVSVVNCSGGSLLTLASHARFSRSLLTLASHARFSRSLLTLYFPPPLAPFAAASRVPIVIHSPCNQPCRKRDHKCWCLRACSGTGDQQHLDLSRVSVTECDPRQHLVSSFDPAA
jgi:hypothetical protein